VLPFVFARADQPFLRSGLPMLVGMAAAFAAVATLAAVAGGWAVEANDLGRVAAIALLAAFGLALVFPALSDHFTRPLVALGDRLSASADRGAAARNSTILPSLLLGVATGLLWAPCAGPVLGLILTGAALQGANAKTTLLLLAYAAGAATSLALALLIGGRVFAAMKRSLGIGEWVRRGVGVAVLAGVAAIALGLDTGFLSRVSYASTASIEQKLLDGLQPAAAAPAQSSVVMNGGPAMVAANPASGDNPAVMTDAKREPSVVMNDSPAMMAANSVMMIKAKPSAAEESLPVEGDAPSLSGAVQWLNSPPLTVESLKGKVVLVDSGPIPASTASERSPTFAPGPRSTGIRGWW
jgi:cytochrome c biogenesis protein CcdA